MNRGHTMRLFFNKFSNLSMLWKFTIIYFVLIMFPTAVIWISYYNWSVQSIREQSDRSMLQTISRIKQNTLYTVKNTENIAEEIIFSNDVQVFLNNDFTFSQDEIYHFIYSIQNQLVNVKHLYSNKYYKIRFFSSNQSIGEEYDIIYSMDRIKDKDYFKEIESSGNRKLWGKVKKAEEYYDINENIRPVQNDNMVIPLYDRIEPVASQKLIGILEINILINKMFEDIAETSPGEGGFVTVMDRDGSLITPITDILLRNHLKPDLFHDASGVKVIKTESGQYRVAYDTVNEIGYKILAAVPESELLSSEARHRNSLVLSMFLGITGVFFITYVITRILFKRFNILIKMMKRIEEGEFDVRMDESRMDEVGKLAHGFNRMAGKLEETVLYLIEIVQIMWRGSTMQRIINNPENVVEDMLEGFLKDHSDLVSVTDNPRVLKYKNAPLQGKVGIVTGGGSGYKPAFIGYIGKNMVDAAAVGEIFSSPTAKAFYDAFKAADSGKGVACLYGNYAGDNMNVRMAKCLQKKKG